MLYPIILCGGSGTRLWPMSRSAHPKQFLNLVSENSSLLQDTVLRLSSLDSVGGVIAVCSTDYRFIVAEQLSNILSCPLKIILEPEPKNTAPAVALGALSALQEDEDAEILVLPSDHSVSNGKALLSAFSQSSKLAKAGRLVTFGVVPTRPETGYGYIEKGEPIENGSGASGFEINRFVEKPNQSTAQGYINGGKHLWNSGMFMFSARGYLDELAKFKPEMEEACKAAFAKSEQDLDFTRVDADSFSGIESDSIDYAVMEHTQKGAVVELDAGWSDVGSWEGLAAIGESDDEGNVTKGDVLLSDSKNSYFHSNGRLIAGIGLSDIAVVETPDAVLVSGKGESQNVKTLVEVLKNTSRPEAQIHKMAFRPWGSYETICMSDRFQVKQIIVKPGQKLSMQKHFHRAEHWIVVRGTALVTRGDEEFVLNEDESTYIPIGCKHRLTNPGKIQLELIEVQSGSYLGEDDIVRYDDVYGRSGDN